MKAKLVWIGLWLVSIAGCFYTGAIVGYVTGGQQYKTRFAHGDALTTVVALRRLREGHVEAVMEDLEIRLDGHIVEHSLFEPLTHQTFQWWLDPVSDESRAQTRKIMSAVQKYRAEHPSPAPPDIREVVEAHLSQFQ